MIKYEEDLPKSDGIFLWHVLDWNYLLVGLIQIHRYNRDNKELEHYLNLEKPPYMYYPHKYFIGPPIEIIHVMTDMAHDHSPPLNSSGKPCVDGYLPFDTRLLSYKDDIINIQAKNLSGLKAVK